MPRIQLDGVAEDLPAAVQRLQGTQVQILHTAADGACAIHSVWGDWSKGRLFKADARKFLGAAFGSTARSKTQATIQGVVCRAGDSGLGATIVSCKTIVDRLGQSCSSCR